MRGRLRLPKSRRSAVATRIAVGMRMIASGSTYLESMEVMAAASIDAVLRWREADTLESKQKNTWRQAPVVCGRRDSAAQCRVASGVRVPLCIYLQSASFVRSSMSSSDSDAVIVQLLSYISKNCMQI